MAEDENSVDSNNRLEKGSTQAPSHYEIKGEWDEERKVYSVHETGNIVTEYKSAYLDQKGRPEVAQQMVKESYRLEQDRFGRPSKKPVEYDSKSGLWKDKSILSRLKDPPIVIGMMVKSVGGDGNVLHTFESNRPVNDTVARVDGKTGENVNIESVLKAARGAEEKQRVILLQQRAAAARMQQQIRRQNRRNMMI